VRKDNGDWAGGMGRAGPPKEEGLFYFGHTGLVSCENDQRGPSKGTKVKGKGLSP